MRIEAGQLGQQHTQPLSFRGNLQAEQLLDGQAITKIVSHGAEIIDAVGERDDLLIKLRLAGLFNAGV